MDTGASLNSSTLGENQTTPDSAGFSPSDSQTLASVQDYYGRVLQTKHDLKTTACCTAEVFSSEIRDSMTRIHPEVSERSYGCGVPIPPALEGCRVLDLGCGAGRDAYLLSERVGERGFVYGVDMTDEQLEVARRHLDYHTEQFGYKSPNVEFRKGYIEDLAGLGIESGSIDLVVSNCVFNLSPAKERLFAEVMRVLKPGGELYFSDVFCDRRLAPELAEDAELLGECLGGALYKEDFRRLMARLGVEDFRVVKQSQIAMTNESVKQKVGEAKFSSITIRAFKLPLEDQCEDYGQAAVYHGTISGHEHAFELDDHHLFEKGRMVAVCRNTADMLSKTRFARHFDIVGEATTHYGLFPCGPGDLPADNASACC